MTQKSNQVASPPVHEQEHQLGECITAAASCGVQVISGFLDV